MGKITKEYMEKLKLKAEERDLKTNLNKARKQGQIPAVLYGHKIKNQHLFVRQADFEKIFKKAGESTIIELETADKKIHPVLIQDVSQNYLTYNPDHVDFYEVDMTEKIRATVNLEFVGESAAIKNMGGTLVRVINYLEVECLPADLPHSFSVDISSLQTFEQSIHIKDLSIPEKVKILADLEDTVAKVQPPRTEEELKTQVTEDISAVEGAVEEKKEGEEDEAKKGKADDKTADKDAKPETDEKKKE